MPKKLNLSELKIQSFVTTLTKEKENKVKGGDTYDCTPDTDPTYCRLTKIPCITMTYACSNCIC